MWPKQQGIKKNSPLIFFFHGLLLVIFEHLWGVRSLHQNNFPSAALNSSNNQQRQSVEIAEIATMGKNPFSQCWTDIFFSPRVAASIDLNAMQQQRFVLDDGSHALSHQERSFPRSLLFLDTAPFSRFWDVIRRLFWEAQENAGIGR